MNLGKWSDENIWQRATGLFLAIGVVTRLVQYLANRSLWLDEVYLAQNIIHRSFAGLTQPLDLQQSAPILFLFAEKLATFIGGTSEYALRFVPLVSGIASLFLFYLIARYFLSQKFLPFAILLFAICEPLVYYSAEVKQYSVDVLVALGITYVALRAHRAGLNLRELMALTGLGAIAIWLSDPAIFVLAGVGSVLAWSSLRERRQAIPPLVFMGVVWLVSFGVLFETRLNNVGSNADLQNYWQDFFVPLPPLSFHQLRLIGDLFGNAFTFIFPPFPGFAELVVTLGLVSGWAQKKLGLVAAPLLFCLIASGLRQYPFYQRFLLFSIPALIILAALGVESIAGVIAARRARVAFALALAAIIFPALLDASLALVHPYQREEIRPVIQYLLAHRQNNDPLYAYYSAVEPLDYYLMEMGAPLAYTRGVNARSDWLAYGRELESWRGKGRVWFLFSHVLRSEGVDEEQLFVQYLNTMGRQVDAYRQTGASVYLYDLE